MKLRNILRLFYWPVKQVDLLFFGRKARERYGQAKEYKHPPSIAWLGELGKDYTNGNIKTTGKLNKQ